MCFQETPYSHAITLNTRLCFERCKGVGRGESSFSSVRMQSLSLFSANPDSPQTAGVESERVEHAREPHFVRLTPQVSGRAQGEIEG